MLDRRRLPLLPCVLTALALACGADDQPGDDDDDVVDDACPLERPATVADFSDACSPGLVCDYGDETCACGTSWTDVCTTCPFDSAAADLDLASCVSADDTCAISDSEHDYACRCVGPELAWICCSEQFAGVVCEGDGCGTEVGSPCCAGQVNDDDGLTCVDGRWQAS